MNEILSILFGKKLKFKNNLLLSGGKGGFSSLLSFVLLLLLLKDSLNNAVIAFKPLKNLFMTKKNNQK